ncbi:hypothetical protein NKR23_g7382 [Pleurostoma richardsiae]|uniref:Uncharacterized protein n=1 Tax=Pleurostoma richardsiae TaxID=41990 RepID=A0AA38RW60_9PEZI|nr:hypothetical protein NKR23_g7382 [Pleurostoma richardsiae]
MCFQEFMGYTCGHSSPPVARPCPMTTALHTNPVCSHMAIRPYLSPSMCPSCQRILHGRAVLIQESEHRFMHERGACGCPVKFPEQIQPQVVGGGAGVPQTQEPQTRDTSFAGAQPNAAIAPTTDAMTMAPLGGAAPAAPPLFQEATTGVNQGVAVRIPSLYAAEWINDHRLLHQWGRCQCPAYFGVYQPSFIDDPLRPEEVAALEDADLEGITVRPAEMQAPRAAGAIHEPDSAPSTNPIFNDACAVGLQQRPVDCQATMYVHSMTPIVGLPIGAGPEGQSHAGEWRTCILRRASHYRRHGRSRKGFVHTLN